MYGYGIIRDRATSMQRQMGGVGYAMNSGRQVNVMNPASYASTDSLTFLWDIGADASILWSKEGSAKQNTIGGGLDYITIQVPVGKHFGASMGMLPVTSVGYSFGNDIKHGSKENQGSGGINQAYIGFSANYFGFALGVNVSYDFGNITNQIYSTPNNASNTLFEHELRVRDWNVTIGAQYTYKISPYDKAVIGVTYNPKKTLHGNSIAMVQNLTNTSIKPDTVGEMKLAGNYFQPNTLGIGVSYSHTRASHMMVEADFTYQDWAKARFSEMKDAKGNVIFAGLNFSNRYKIAVGGEYMPKVRGSYGQRITYRLGAHYVKDYLVIKGNNVREYGVSCGVGLPTADGRTIVNLGLEWLHRSSSPATLISENYLNITLGVNFNEVWFWQRRIK